MKKVVVIGGGIIGLSSAYYLQQAGHKVIVLDKGDFTDNCSYGNAGYVCPGHFIPLAAPGMVWKGFKWMLNPASPFYIQPSFDLALFDWGYKFIKSATRKNVEASAIPLRDIAVFSQQEYKKWASRPDFDFSFQQKGLLEIYQTKEVARHAPITVQKGRSLGLEVDLLNRDQLLQMEPHTRINALGAIYFKTDAHLNPDRLMKSLLGYLVHHGVQLVAGAEVTGFEKGSKGIHKVKTALQDYEADEIVLAAGAWSRSLASMLDARIPLMPGRGYSLTLEDSAWKLNHPAILVEGRVAITPIDTNLIRFGGTMEVVSTQTAPRYQRMRGILNAVRKFLPDFNIPMPSTNRLWYGYRPCSADGLPYIGRIRPYKNVVVATGHSMLGLSLGAGTGKLVSELVDEKKPSIDISAFAVERFGKKQK